MEASKTIAEVAMGLVTFPEALRRIDKPRSWGERVLWQYRDVLPVPTRLGSARVYPESIVDRLRDIARREAEARR
jgi:hypothetical protein